MSFREQASQSAAESGGNGSDEDIGIEVDFDETPFIRAHPTTFVSGAFPEDEGNPIIRFRNAEYNNGRYDQGSIALVLDEPEFIIDEEEGTEGTVILETDDSDSTDIRVFNADDENTEVVDNEGMTGVKYDSNGTTLYEGEFLDPGDVSGRVVVVTSGSSSKHLAKALDINGAMDAGMGEDGWVNDGLIEYKPYDIRTNERGEITSRYARNPELKERLYGRHIGVFLGRREELDDDVTGYVGMNSEPDEDDPVMGVPEDGSAHDDPDRASYAERVAAGERYPMKWYQAFDISEGESIEPEVTGVEPSDGNYTWLEDEWGQFDAEAGRLSDDQWSYVEEYVSAVEAGQVDADEETIRGHIEEDAEAGEFEEEPETEKIVGSIQRQT